MVGAFWGSLLGLIGSKVLDRKHATVWVVTGAATGGLIFGSEGYRQGVELAQWLRQY
jgi:hypothetical protein